MVLVGLYMDSTNHLKVLSIFPLLDYEYEAYFDKRLSLIENIQLLEKLIENKITFHIIVDLKRKIILDSHLKLNQFCKTDYLKLAIY